MNHHMPIAILTNYEHYGLKAPTLGFSLPSITFNPSRRVLTFGEGSWIEVEKSDLVEITLTENQKRKIFPLYE